MQSLLLMLAALVFCDITSGLFYTSSKENDYPRIGKRKDRGFSDVWVTDNFDDYNDIMDSNDINPTQSLAPSRTGLIRKGTVMLFKLLDRNGKIIEFSLKEKLILKKIKLRESYVLYCFFLKSF